MKKNKKNDVTQKKVDVLVSIVGKLKMMDLTQNEVNGVCDYLNNGDYDSFVAYFDSKITKREEPVEGSADNSRDNNESPYGQDKEVQ